MRRALRWAAVAAVFWVLFVGLPAIPAVRAVLAGPLVVHDPDARGDLAYVMAGGHAMHERLRAAADLFHQGRVPRIWLMDEPRWGNVYYPAGRNWTAAEWAVGRLQWLGVPPDRIRVLSPPIDDVFGTRGEARLVAGRLPAGVRRVVVVTSAAHTRRSRLAFRRALPPDVEVAAFAATRFVDSAERYRPLFLEYAKLVVYFFAA